MFVGLFGFIIECSVGGIDVDQYFNFFGYVVVDVVEVEKVYLQWQFIE